MLTLLKVEASAVREDTSSRVGIFSSMYCKFSGLNLSLITSKLNKFKSVPKIISELILERGGTHRYLPVPHNSYLYVLFLMAVLPPEHHA